MSRKSNRFCTTAKLAVINLAFSDKIVLIIKPTICGHRLCSTFFCFVTYFSFFSVAVAVAVFIIHLVN